LHLTRELPVHGPFCLIKKAVYPFGGTKGIHTDLPKPGWVEHDPNEIWSSQVAVAAEAISKLGINGKAIAGIGIRINVKLLLSGTERVATLFTMPLYGRTGEPPVIVMT
jgi:hypothetical protein